MGKKRILLFLFLITLLIGSVGWWAESRMKRMVEDQTAQYLRSILSSTSKVMDLWLEEQLIDSLSIARSAEFFRLLEGPLAAAVEENGALSLPAEQGIKDSLMPLLTDRGYTGFSIFDRTFRDVVSHWPRAADRTDILAGTRGSLERAFQGESLSTVPLKIPLQPPRSGQAAEESFRSYIFLLNPIRNAEHQVIAVFVVGVDAYDSLSRVTSLAGFEETGESYAFDGSGLLATASRFEDDLRHAGLLLEGQSSEGSVDVRDPGGDLTKGFVPSLPRPEQPLTLMAAEALKGRSGVDVRGYRDYRGVVVVGAWTWNRKVGLGLATEIDRAEVYQILFSVRMLSLTALALILTATAVLLIFLERNSLKTHLLNQKLQESQDSLIKAQQVARLGNWDWDFITGAVLWSDETFRLLGLDREKTSASFECYMASVHPDDRSLIEKRLDENLKGIRDFDTEHRIILPDGDIRWMDTKGEIFRNPRGEPVRMVGTMQDITEDREVREELRNYKENLEQTVQERTTELIRTNRELQAEIQERKAAEDRIRIHQARMDGIIQTAADGILTADESGRIHTFNPAAESIFGYRAEEAAGLSLDALMTLPEPPPSGSYRTGDALGIRKDGTTIMLEISLSEFDDCGTRMLTAIVHDITERKQTESALKQAKIAAEEASQAKSRFLANMSHEIRTPMNSVIGYLDLTLEKRDLDQQSRQNLSTASRSARTLLRLINDILDISKMEAGKMELEEARFNLFQLLDDVTESFREKVQVQDLTMDINTDSRLSQCYMGDYTRLRQVLINLIGNAVKFTEKGGVTVLAAPADRKGYLHFTVRDTGIGIPPEKIDTILEPFNQADISTTRNFGGTGLGTTISRQIVEMMDGDMWIESKLDRGSSFHFSVRVPEAECVPGCGADCEEFDPESVPGESGEIPLVSKRVFKVLLAEDVRENAELAAIRLEQKGHRLIHVRDGQQAVERWQEEDFDLILMDVQMPRLDGLEASRQIRHLESGTGKRTPIIALTASVMAEEKQLCLDAGMDLVAGKPVDFPILFARMEQIVPKGRGRAMMPPAGSRILPRDQSPPYLPGVDVQRGLQRWQDLSAYLRNLRIFAASHADTAGEIKALIDAGDNKESYRKAHALKGLAGNLAMDRVYPLAVRIDDALKAVNPAGAAEMLPLLADALFVVIQGIRRLPEEEPVSGDFQEDMDKPAIAALLQQLFHALEQYTPTAAEPLLEDLTQYLRADRLQGIREALDLFDFGSAQEETVELAESLDIRLDVGL